MKAGNPVRVKQTEFGHGQPAGTTWDVQPIWVTAIPAPAKPVRTSKPKAPPAPPRARTSRVKITTPKVPKEPVKPLSKAPPTFTAQRESIEHAYSLLKKWGCEGWRVEFSGALPRAMGKAHLGRRLIKFSVPLWDQATNLQRRETVVYEVAHAVCYVRGTDRGHGAGWKAQMAAMGYPNASKYHTVDRTGLKRKRHDTVEVACCGKFYRAPAGSPRTLRSASAAAHPALEAPASAM